MTDFTPISRLYNLVKGEGNGHCDDHLPAFESSYHEAFAMAQSAIDAIEAVKNGRMTNWIRTSANHRKARMLLIMFGVRAAGIFQSMSSEYEFRGLGLFTRNPR